MTMKKHIPNVLTLGNLICGILAIRSIFLGDVNLAIAFVFIAAFLDFFDGMVARLLGVSGELGKQLDSLADNVTFGVVPGLMLLSISGFLRSWPVDWLGWLLFVSCLLVSAMATMRLGMFNIDIRQAQGFIGMPTPGNTLLVSSMYYLFYTQPADGWMNQLHSHQMLFIAVIILIAIWQVLPIPLMALKFKTFSIRQNSLRYAFIVLAIFMVAIFRVSGIPILIGLYFLLSLVNQKLEKTAPKNS